METIYRDYAPKGVKFYYIYKSLAHPELKGYINPLTLEERFMHVEEAKRTLGSKIPWLVDRMDNQIKHALGNKSNVELIVDPQGRVVPRLERPVTGHDYMLPVVRQAQWREGDEPFYVKLRAEAHPSLLKEGAGRLWIGFFMDPLYGVHWNNLTDPIRVMIDVPEGMTVSPARLEDPKPEVESDIDPREFLVDVTGGQPDRPLRVTAFYFACQDEEGWCKPLTQRYQLYLKHDHDGGNSPARSSYGHSAQQCPVSQIAIGYGSTPKARAPHSPG